jgi:hypothetical protein
MRITRFSGRTPAISARHLQPGAAVLAENTRTTDGTLRAMREPLALGACSGEYVLADSGDYICGKPCSVADLSGCGAGRIGVVGGALTFLGSGNPVVPPQPAMPGILSPIPDTGVLTSFRIANITPEGGVSMPSLNTSLVNAAVGKPVRLNTSGNVRVYALLPASIDGRLPEQGEAAAQWVVVGDFTGRAVFDFTPDSWALSDDAQADEQCAPVGVQCVTRDELGHYYAWSKTEVWISDRNSATIWPQRGHVTLEHNIVHAVPMYDMLLVATTGVPFVIRPNPTNDGSLNPLAVPYTAHHGVVGGANVVSRSPLGMVYPSRMGMMVVTGQAPSGYQLITRDVINAEEWSRDWLPLAVGEHHGSVVTDKWVLDIRDNQHGANVLNSFYTHTFPVDRLQSLPDGRLIVFSAGQAFEWQGGDYARAVYESETIVEQGHRVFTAGKVVGTRLNGVKMSIIDADDDTVVDTVTLTNGDNNVPFRITPYRGMHYRVRVVIPASAEEIVISEIHVGPDINDLTRPEGVAT